MPYHHMQHMRNVGPNLLARNENSAYVMPCVTAHAVISCAHCMACACRQAATLCIRGTPGITYGHAVHASQKIFIKNNCLTF